MEAEAGFAPLLIVIALAFIVPLLLVPFKRPRLPIVVGEILAGIVIGRSGFGWVTHEEPLLTLLAEFENINVTVFNPALDQAALLSLLARNPDIYELLTRTDDNKEVGEVVVYEPNFYDKALREIDLPGDVLILSIRRSGEFIVPRGHTQLEQGDHLTLVGGFEHLQEARTLFSGIESRGEFVEKVVAGESGYAFSES